MNLVYHYKENRKYIPASEIEIGMHLIAIRRINRSAPSSIEPNTVCVVEKIRKCQEGCHDYCCKVAICIYSLETQESIWSCNYELKTLDGRLVVRDDDERLQRRN